VAAGSEVHFYDSSGRRLNDSLGSETKPGPRLADQAEDLGLRDGHPETVPAVSGDGRWRVLLNPGPDGMSSVVTFRSTPPTAPRRSSCG
jgi:two-component system OmpR family sensor kinase